MSGFRTRPRASSPGCAPRWSGRSRWPSSPAISGSASSSCSAGARSAAAAGKTRRGWPTRWRRSWPRSCSRADWIGRWRCWSACSLPSSSKETWRGTRRRSCSSCSRAGSGRRNIRCWPSTGPITRAPMTSRCASTARHSDAAPGAARRKRSRRPPWLRFGSLGSWSGRSWTSPCRWPPLIRAGGSWPWKRPSGCAERSPRWKWSTSAARPCRAWRGSRSSICWSAFASCRARCAFPTTRPAARLGWRAGSTSGSEDRSPSTPRWWSTAPRSGATRSRCATTCVRIRKSATAMPETSGGRSPPGRPRSCATRKRRKAPCETCWNARGAGQTRRSTAGRYRRASLLVGRTRLRYFARPYARFIPGSARFGAGRLQGQRVRAHSRSRSAEGGDPGARQEGRDLDGQHSPGVRRPLRRVPDQPRQHRRQAVRKGRSEDGGQLRGPRYRQAGVGRPAHRQEEQRQAVRRDRLPPRDPAVHDPGGRSPGDRHWRTRVQVRGRVPERAQVRPARAAGDGERGPEHQRIAVLHHRSTHPAPQQPPHHLRRGGEGAGADPADRPGRQRADASRQGRDRPQRQSAVALGDPRKPGEPHRAGFVAIVGRPNVGKSTLLNRLVGQKLAIVSPKPQTTRGRILGVITRPDAQVALLDTPGLHTAKGGLNARMVQQALQTLSDADLAAFLIEAGPPSIDAATRRALDQVKAAHKPTLLVINKVDTVPRARVLPLIDRWKDLHPWTDVYPLSALKGENVDGFLDALIRHLPEAPPMFPPEQWTDMQERDLSAELIREQLLRQTGQEVPYSAAVLIEQFDESERSVGPRGLVRVSATVLVERDSQKAIVIGKGGARLKEIGTAARREMERLLGSKVFLQIHVRVEPGWTRTGRGLRRAGYED